MDELLTIPEAAALIRVSQETVRRRIRSGALPIVAASGPRSQRVRRSDLLAERSAPYVHAPAESSEATDGGFVVNIGRETSRRLDAHAGATGLDRDALAGKLLDDALADFEQSVAGIRRGEAAGAAGREVDFEAYVQRDRAERSNVQ